MFQTLKQWFTERDNQTMCLVRALAATGALDMLYRLYEVTTPSFQDFGIGFAAILGAIAVKNLSENS